MENNSDWEKKRGVQEKANWAKGGGNLSHNPHRGKKR